MSPWFEGARTNGNRYAFDGGEEQRRGSDREA